MARCSTFLHVAHSNLNNRLHHLLNHLRSPMATPTRLVRPEPKLKSPGNVLNRQTWRVREQWYMDRSGPTQRATAHARCSGRPLRPDSADDRSHCSTAEDRSTSSQRETAQTRRSGRPLQAGTAEDRALYIVFCIHPSTSVHRHLIHHDHSFAIRPIQTTRVAIHRKTIKQYTSFVSR